MDTELLKSILENIKMKGRSVADILKKVNAYDIAAVLKVFLAIIPAIFVSLSGRKIWIITERSDEAKDNGYWFYKYASSHSKSEVYYAINYNCHDYALVKEIGKVLRFGSIKHYVYTFACTKYISSQYSNGFPSRIVYYLWLYNVLKMDFYFLQHGVTQNKSKYLEEPSARAKLFCCVSDREAEFVKELGYCESSTKVLGFCRYDGLNDCKENIIFIMFTWRKYLANISEKDFTESVYYKKISHLISNPSFYESTKQDKVYFVLHPGMKKYAAHFHKHNENVKVININDISFQMLISRARLFITDYSSIAFDFAYLNKPVIYYQFDYAEFRSNHLQEGYYDYENDGFGPVFNDDSMLIDCLHKEQYDGSNYLKRRNFFKYKDKNNCERVYEYVKDH